MADTRIVGSILGETALAAVGAASPLNDLLLGLLTGVAEGFGIVIATYFGAQSMKEMKNSIGSSILYGVLSTIVISALCLVFLSNILDYGFILYLEMGVSGAAYATVISQAISALLCFIYMKHKYPQLKISREDFIPYPVILMLRDIVFI